MRRYYSYKDSGVEWIGEIPTEWGIKRLKYVSDVKPSNVDKHIFPDELQVRLCNYTDVYYNDFITDSTELKNGSCTRDEFEKFKISKGDVIITKDSESPDDIGIPSLVKDNFDDVVCGYHLTVIKPKTINGGFIFRFIQSDRTRRYFEIHSNGITRYGLGKSSIENLFLPFPPLSEQQQIVSYLDTKTSLIDSLIEKTKLKIQLLKEKRTSLINEVVTKGLNPNVEMKDSGVEWIGEIPSHWIKSKLKFVSKIITGNTPPTKDEDNYESGEYLWVKPNEIKGFTPTNDTNEKLTEKGKSISKVLPPLSVFVNGIGRIGEFGYSEKFVSTNQQINSIVFNHLVDKRFGLFHTSMMKEGFVSNSEKVVVPILNKSKQENLEFILPPLSEQQQIVSYLDEHTQLIDKTISVEERRIDTLKEYRQSLISEVVTGKIDVRVN
jgi:type I restriction enzyme S subunit